MHFKYKTLCLAIAAMGFGNAYADEGDKMFSFSGFGTIGVIQSSAKNADFVNTINMPTGVGASESTSFSQLSRLGVQIDGKFSDTLSGVVQAVSERNYDNSFTPLVTQAHLKYKFTPAFDVRVGRMPIALFMLTDFARISYAMPYATTPLETYTTNMEVDGIDTTYKFNLGEVAMTAQAYYGSLDYKVGVKAFPDPVTLKITDSKGVNLSADYGASTLRIVYISSQFTAKNPTSEAGFDVYRNMGYGYLADHYQPKNHQEDFVGLGYSYDPGSWFMRAEASKNPGADDTFAKITTYYVSGGYRIGQFTPYAIYGRLFYHQATSLANDPGAFMGPGSIGGQLAANDNSRHSISIGTRWDFHENMAFKLQYSQITRDTSTSNNALINVQAGTTVPDSYNLVMATYDFVF